MSLLPRCVPPSVILVCALGIFVLMLSLTRASIDDRVRAISLAMGMVPIMWSRTPSGGVFDTNGAYLLVLSVT